MLFPNLLCLCYVLQQQMALILNKLDVPSERLPVTILVRQKSVKRPVEVIPHWISSRALLTTRPLTPIA